MKDILDNAKDKEVTGTSKGNFAMMSRVQIG